MIVTESHFETSLGKQRTTLNVT